LASLVNPLTVAAAGVGLLGAGLVDSIGKAGAFDQKMAEIRATMQPTGAEMDKLRGLALQLGAATDVGSVSASDAAEAIGVLGKAGIGADAQLAGVTHSVLQLAAAAGPEFGVAKSAELASDALNSFGLKAGDAKGVVDTLVGAANASSIGLEDLKYGLAASGAVAHTVGLSFKDTATALAVMGANGLKGSDAGTSLKTMLMNLQPHTKAATAEMMALGLVTKDGSNQFFDAQGHMKSMSDVAQILQTSLKGMTDQQRLAALQTMFGSDAIRGASILADQGATGIDKMSAAMAQQGDAAKVAGDMNNNFKGKMEALGGTVETIQIAIGSALTPVLGGLADMLNNSLGNALTNIPALLANIGAALQQAGTFFQPLISGIQAFIAANPQPVLYGVAGALAVALVPALVAAAAAAWAFIAPILAVVAPVLAVGVAIGALKLAWDNNFLGMRDTLIPIWNEITETLTSFWNDIQPDLTAAWTNIQKMAGDAMTFIQTALTTLKKGWDSDWGGIKTILTEVWNVISTTVKTVWDIVSGLISAGLKVLQGDWSGAWTVVKTTLNTVWEDMKTLLGSAITAIGTAITNFVPTLISKLAEWGGAFLGWVAKDVLPTIAAKVGEIAPKWGRSPLRFGHGQDHQR
jgi:TP901 family phage tail tape measure protein